MVLERPDGTRATFSAWHHRKGHGLIDEAARAGLRDIPWWAPDRRGWWIAVLFMIGSLCFALGAFPATALLFGSAVVWVFFIGSIFFTSASYLQFYEVTNEGDDPQGQGRTRRLFGIRPASLGWWAAAIQLVGTLWFNLTTFAGTRTTLTTPQEAALVWAPDAIGSICFLVASALAIIEVRDTVRGWWPRALESTIAMINMAGSIAFGISAMAAFILPQTGELLNSAAANAGTFVGAILFLLGAFLLLPDLGRSTVAAEVT